MGLEGVVDPLVEGGESGVDDPSLGDDDPEEEEESLAEGRASWPAGFGVMDIAFDGPLPILGRSFSGNFSSVCEQRSATEAPPSNLRTGTSVLNSFKNQDRTSTATSESMPSSTKGT